MKNRFTGVVIGQIIALIIVCCMSTFIALISFGGIAGVVIGTKPKESLLYAAKYACPNGKVDYQESHASYNRPGENNIAIECVAPDGSRTDITFTAIGYSLLGIYLACFLPMCIPGGFLALIIPLFFLRRKKQDNIIEVLP
jgi:hypothetical protein